MRPRVGLESEHELKGCVGVRRWDWDRGVKPSSVRDGLVTAEEQGGCNHMDGRIMIQEQRHGDFIHNDG